MTDHAAIQQAIADAEALGVTEAQLYELAKTALASALRTGAPTSAITLPTGVSITVDLATLRVLLTELRAVARAEAGGSIAFGRAVLP